MKQILLFAVTILCCITISAQVTTESIDSRLLNSTRHIKIKLPKNYQVDSGIKHPLIIVLDGEYLFNPTVGQTDFQTYFDDMPGSIVVGVMHEDVRYYDTYHDEVSGLPIEFGAKFYEFLARELVPYVDAKYNTSNFRVVIGHDITANLMNSFLLKEQPLFQAYVNISPEFVGNMSENILKRMQWLKSDIIYYMATSSDDVKTIRNAVLQTHSEIKALDNSYLTYYFDDFEDATHFTLATQAISRAFDKIFNIYGPITDKEIEEQVMPYEGSLDKYLKDRYKNIEDLFGISKSITEDEVNKVADAAIEREDLKSLEKLGQLVKTLDPNKNLGTYYMALYAEKIGKNKKAVKLYEEALEMDESNIIDKTFLATKLKDLKTLVGSNDDDEDDDE